MGYVLLSGIGILMTGRRLMMHGMRADRVAGEDLMPEPEGLLQWQEP